MSPEEKAKELIDKFMNQDIHARGLHLKRNNPVFRMHFQSAKQCALILIEEVMKFPMPVKTFKYYQQVKQAILNH